MQNHENGVVWGSQDHSRSLKMVPFDRQHKASYKPSMLTMSLSCYSCTGYEIIAKYWSKIADFSIPCIFRHPHSGRSNWNFITCFGIRKLQYPGHHAAL